MHIADQVREVLKADGWNEEHSYGNVYFTKRIRGFAEAGTISDGTRIVHLQICERGRYLERVDMGLGCVERDVDLRDFINDANGAINKVLK